MKQLFSLLAASILLTSGFLTTPVFADSYGNDNGQPSDLYINKQVQNPITNGWVENLGSTDPTFSPGSTVTFLLTVTNGSGETFNPVEVVDQLPTYLTYLGSSVPASYDAGQHRIVMHLDNVIAGETRNITITTQVADKSAFPTNDSVFCATNYSKVTAPSRPSGDDDTADFCITTKVGTTSTLPVAGFNDFATLIPFLSLGGIGLVMLKKKI
jgi:uncharacterized repeat protein (TIGR01451 family)